ncbi:ABC transporter substrate-binding protein [Selenomonadales bacterium OttesenSCG-928-I06]|nr:ABC transporter substrate-binding protein [Selenomonadales bacterium OttesenSCG-928-I06]
MKNRLVLILAAIICFSLLLSGCSKNAITPQEGQYKVTDSRGKVIKLNNPPVRIVSLTLCSDEILLELVSKDRIVAFTNLSKDAGISNIVEESKAVFKLPNQNAETIISLKPDIIIAADWHSQDLIKILEEIGLNVYVYKTPDTIEEVKGLIIDLSQAVDSLAKGKELVRDMELRLSNCQNKVKDIPVKERKTIIALSPMGCYGGTGSMLDDIYKNSFVINGASLLGISKDGYLSKEQLVSVNPDVIMISTWAYEDDSYNNLEEEISNDSALKTVNAVKNRSFIKIDSKYTYATSQYVVFAVENIIREVYPAK